MVMTKRGKALFVALCAASPKLAQDSALPALVGQVRPSNFDAAGIKAKLIAMDAESKEKTEKIVDSMKDMDDEPEAKEPKVKPAKDRAAKDAEPEDEDETEEERKERLEKRKAAKEKAAKDAACAKDEEKEKEKEEKEEREKETKQAMDSFRRELREAEEARREVRPVVGEVLAQDSAAGIYEFALDTLKVDHKDVAGVPALRALYRVASSKSATAPTVAMDHSAVADVEKRFPGFSRVRQA